jgi:hypothetical protein
LVFFRKKVFGGHMAVFGKPSTWDRGLIFFFPLDSMTKMTQFATFHTSDVKKCLNLRHPNLHHVKEKSTVTSRQRSVEGTVQFIFEYSVVEPEPRWNAFRFRNGTAFWIRGWNIMEWQKFSQTQYNIFQVKKNQKMGYKLSVQQCCL